MSSRSVDVLVKLDKHLGAVGAAQKTIVEAIFNRLIF